MNDRLLTTKEAARFLGVSAAFLERDRWAGAEIPFVRIGSRAVRYQLIIEFHNPSVRDYLETRVRSYTEDWNELVSSAVFPEQILVLRDVTRSSPPVDAATYHTQLLERFAELFAGERVEVVSGLGYSGSRASWMEVSASPTSRFLAALTLGGGAESRGTATATIVSPILTFMTIPFV